ncbi:MAG: 50S ribosomal protein L18 [Coprothermobacterota bacterium]|jgi:large subunit ribosomal protein L18|nr:50S ribosomal protein L18 [Caldisericota bacterium]MDI6869146.1 50S ribosomal protein L18 [Coprothermobacterota bacterium]
MAYVKNTLRREIRHKRVRRKVAGNPDRPRLSVFRALRHIYAQVIDDAVGRTLVSASSLDEEIRSQSAGKTKTEVAALVGSLVAKRCLEKGVAKVVFDRGGYKFHGRVKALADAARAAGLEF